MATAVHFIRFFEVVYNSIIHNRQNLETAQISKRRKDKQTVIHLCNRILVSTKKEKPQIQ